MVFSIIRKIFSPLFPTGSDTPNESTASSTAHMDARLLQSQDTWVAPVAAPSGFDGCKVVQSHGITRVTLPRAPNTPAGGSSTDVGTTGGPFSGPTQAEMEALAQFVDMQADDSLPISLDERHQQTALSIRVRIFSELPKRLTDSLQSPVYSFSDADRQHLLALAQMTATYDTEILESGGMKAYDHAETHMKQILAHVEMLSVAPRAVVQGMILDLEVPVGETKYTTDSPYLLYTALITLQSPDQEFQKLARNFLYFNAKLFSKALDPKTRLYHENIKKGQSSAEELHLDINRGEDQIDTSSGFQFNYTASETRMWALNSGLPASDAHAIKPWLESFHKVRQQLLFTGQDSSYTVSYIHALPATLGLPSWRKARVKCAFTDPLNRFLPANMALKAEAQLQAFDARCAASPSFGDTPGLKKEADVLRESMQTAQLMDTHSRADGVIWEQLAYLLYHDIELCDLNAQIIASCKTLQRELALDDLLNGDLDAPSKVSQASAKKERKKARKKAEAKQSASIQVRAEGTQSHARPASTPQEVSAHLARDFTTVFHPATRTPRTIMVGGVGLYTRLSQGQLQRCLLNFVEPSSFLRQRNTDSSDQASGAPAPDDTYIAASAASVSYHIAKHAPGSTVEAYIGEAMAFYNSEFKEKQARVSAGVYAPNTKVRYIYTQDRFATYSEDGKFITYCNRNTCDKNHYSQVTERT
jgi:hypothetical protein